MKARILAVAGVMAGILTLAGLTGDGQEEKVPRKGVDDHFVTTVGTHVLCDGKVSVRVYEEKGKPNFRVNGRGPVPPLIEEGSPWFIYARSPEEIWAFDGKERLFLYEHWPVTSERNRRGIFEIGPDSDFRVPAARRIADKAPEELRDRLPAAFRAKFPGDVPGVLPARPVEGDPPVRKVLASDIGGRVQIIGRLGHPLGELITIRGAWVRPGGPDHLPVKDSTPYFEVSSVDGKDLDRPVKIEPFLFTPAWSAERMPREEGPVWEIRGCETGGFWGTPDAVALDASKRLDPHGMVPQPPRANQFGFYTGFLYSSFQKVPTPVDRAPKAAAPANAAASTFLATVTRVDIGNVSHPFLRWVVVLKVDKLVSGPPIGDEFWYAIHSPSQEGVKVGQCYRIVARRKEAGYEVVSRDRQD